MWTSSQLALVPFLRAGQAFAVLLSAPTDRYSCVPTSFLLSSALSLNPLEGREAQERHGPVGGRKEEIGFAIKGPQMYFDRCC